jgi:putative oxidoreductase
MAVDNLSRTKIGPGEEPRLLIPALGGLYAALANPADAILRIVAGFPLILHGYGKITNPFGAVEMVERIGFHPGVFWSPMLAVGEFFSGILLTLGFLTRPAAAVALVILLVTIYFHWIVAGQGFAGSEKSILWSAMLFFILVRGGRALSVDRAIGREV